MTRSSSYVLQLILLLTFAAGCRRSKIQYPYGRDTYKLFGDGRFQLFYAGNGHISLADCENDPTYYLPDVESFKFDGSSIYLITTNKSYHILSIQPPSMNSYDKISDVPNSDKNEFYHGMKHIRRKRSP